jgi:hypothetical protein
MNSLYKDEYRILKSVEIIIRRCQWFMPAILATQEEKIRRIAVQSQLRQIVGKTLSQKNSS